MQDPVSLERDEFADQLIIELKRQQQSEPAVASPAEGYRSLCYDFPRVKADELDALNSALLRAIETDEIQGLTGEYTLTNKFLENIITCATTLESSQSTSAPTDAAGEPGVLATSTPEPAAQATAAEAAGSGGVEARARMASAFEGRNTQPATPGGFSELNALVFIKLCHRLF